MDDRIQRELALLRRHYPKLQYWEEGRWVLLPEYRLPDGVWKQSEASVVVQFPPGFPGNAPYAFHANPPPELKGGGVIKNATASNEPPFQGRWLKFSWSIPEWRATADLSSGFNMLNFVLTIEQRLREGA
jgi:hypothetical protein